MKWRIQFAEDGSCMTVTAWGTAEVQGFIAYLLEAVAHPSWRPDIPALMDFRNLDIGTLGSADMQRLADLHRPHTHEMAAGRIAVVVTKPEAYGMVRMWESFAHQMHLTHNVFYALEEAEDWLRRS